MMPDSSPMRVLLPDHCRTRVREHAEASYPDECCGLLVGACIGDWIRVHRAAPVTNDAADTRDRYEISPKAYVRIDREARAHGLDVVGVYHSHPDAPAEPSATDLAAAWPGYAYVIVPVDRGVAGPWRVWMLAEHATGRRMREAAAAG